MKKRSTKKAGVVKVRSVITSKPKPQKKGRRGRGPIASDWYQAGPLWVQSGGFGQTDPFKETMGPKKREREKRIRRQNARALRLLARARR